MEKLFRIRASQCSKIMGRIGLTDKQLETLVELRNKPKRTPIQESTMQDLIIKFDNPKLPDTCTTYLKEWYANDQEEIRSKYLDKGIAVEDDLIDFAAEQLGYGMAEKNKIRLSDEYFDGECDIEFPDAICDVKAAWNRKTLHDRVDEGLSIEHEYQLRVYMHLWRKNKGILFTGLMNTPETDWTPEIVFDDMPVESRWVAYTAHHDPLIIKEIQDRVILCRKWLTEYDIKMKSKLGKINP